MDFLSLDQPKSEKKSEFIDFDLILSDQQKKEENLKIIEEKCSELELVDKPEIKTSV